MSKSNDLSTFLVDYGPSFARTAYLLTGDQDRARTLATDALVTVCRRWPAIRSTGPALLVLRELYRRFLAADVPPPATYPLAVLPPRTRATVVARYHDALHPQQVAMLTGTWIGELDKELQQALAHLRSAHPGLFPAAPQPPAEGEQGPDWAHPSETAQAAAPHTPEDQGPRGALVALAAELPATHTDLAAPVLALIGRKRRIRVATWTTVSVGTVGAFVALIVLGVNAMVANVERTIARSSPTSAQQAEEDVPDPLPATLDDPIQYAYLGYCRGRTDNDPSNPQPCAQWRLQTTSGNEWRLGGARAGYEEDSRTSMPLAISQDGRRIAYRQLDGAYVVRDVPSGAVKTIDVEAGKGSAHLTSSPNGRYFSVDFGSADGATLDFDTGVTHYEYGDEVRILAVADDGTRVVAEKEKAKDIPGHASITKLFMNGLTTLEGDYRVDPGLLDFGGALSPDGRTLALITADSELVTMDGRTGRVGGPRTDLADYDLIGVERWTGPEEVLVRSWDDDYVMLTKVNVKSGAVTEVAGDWVEWLDYESPIGAVRP
ncbi:unnamed protein product [[Actinomadura] parvosata subsp. kistnae]|uniref:hypothetical protein n=1 Tax=[Actinomadura] parvosata TaxID=1955412 RepID=UPI000D2DA1A6|nr:hypothetical protein [Nonomuraea sp. ATCC 55076]SPL95133.1 unnamed protein product [Actinomadura parvosata subsp. kistnae]